MEKTIAGKNIEVTEEGYLKNMADWSEDVAKELAKEEDIELTDDHMAVLKYLREKQEAGEQLTIRKIKNSGIVDIKGFYKLFPGGPLKKASKLAGRPKPTSCV